MDGETGYLVPLGDESKMADRILSLLSEPERAKDMGKKGAERINEHFTFERMLNEYLNLYSGKDEGSKARVAICAA